jgi:hypothetical protein
VQEKHDALVEITLPREANIFASEYRLYLPSKEDLRLRGDSLGVDTKPFTAHQAVSRSNGG